MVRKHKLKDIKDDFKFMGFNKDKPYEKLSTKEKGLIKSLLNLTTYTKPKKSKYSRIKSFYNQLRK